MTTQDQVSFQLKAPREHLTHETATNVVEPLKGLLNQELVSIKLNGKSFGPEAATVFAKVFENLPQSMKQVDFSDIIAGRDSDVAQDTLAILSAPFQNKKYLIEINVSDNALGLRGLNAMAHLLEKQDHLERLYANNDGLDTEAAKRLAELLLHRESTTLKTFQISNNLLHDGGALAIAPILARSPQLEELQITGTRFTKKGGLDSLTGLEQGSKNLVRVELVDNSFGGKAAEVLSRILAKQTKLQHLNLNFASLEDVGVQHVMAGLLAGNAATTLETLELGGNEITADGAAAIAKFLSKATSLKKLNLSENELASKGAKRISEILAGNSQLEAVLKELDLKENQISEGAVKVIEKTLSKYEDLNVDLEDNEEEEEEEEEEESGEESGEEEDDIVSQLTKGLQQLNVNKN